MKNKHALHGQVGTTDRISSPSWKPSFGHITWPHGVAQSNLKRKEYPLVIGIIILFFGVKKSLHSTNNLCKD